MRRDRERRDRGYRETGGKEGGMRPHRARQTATAIFYIDFLQLIFYSDFLQRFSTAIFYS